MQATATTATTTTPTPDPTGNAIVGGATFPVKLAAYQHLLAIFGEKSHIQLQAFNDYVWILPEKKSIPDITARVNDAGYQIYSSGIYGKDNEQMIGLAPLPICSDSGAVSLVTDGPPDTLRAIFGEKSQIDPGDSHSVWVMPQNKKIDYITARVNDAGYEIYSIGMHGRYNEQMIGLAPLPISEK